MKDDALDRMLRGEEELVPSSGFAAGVMERVREEAAAPPPLEFPWKRVLPGAIIAAAALGWGAVELARTSAAALRDSSQGAISLPMSATHGLHSFGWIVLALGVSMAGWLAARRLSGDSGLI